MRYPEFYERYRQAIRNTWTVEEIDFSDDVVDLHGSLLVVGAPPDPPAGGVLRHRRLDRRQQPRAQPVQAHQRPRGPAVPVPPALRGSAARAVLPHPARHLPARPRRAGRGVPGRRDDPVDPGQGRVLLPVDELDRRARRAAHARGPAHVPAQPGLLRRLHRGAVLLRRLRLRVLPAVQGPAQRPGGGHELGVPRRERAHGLRLRRGRHRAGRGARPVRRRAVA